MEKTKKVLPKYKIVKEKNCVEVEARRIVSSEQAADFFREVWQEDMEVYECFYVLLMNKNNHVKGWSQLSKGGMTACIVDIKILGKLIIETMSTAIIVGHNHPSGNLKASEADKRITEKIETLGKLLDCVLLDHMILTETSYFSFADEGLINF